MAVRFLPATRSDIKNALKWSADNFGTSAVQRYQKLLSVAIAEIDANPELAHSYEVRGLQPGVRMYHLKHSRERARVNGQIVRRPRHFIVYTFPEGKTTIVRVLHDRMELARQLGEAEEV